MKILTAVTGTPSTDTWTAPAQQTTILNAINVRYPRLIILSSQGVRVSHGGIVAGITIADLIKAMVTLEPGLTWPPVISSQPVAVSTTLPASPSFSVVGTSETGISTTFEWFYSTDNGATFNTLVGVSGFTGAATNVMNVSNAQGLNGYQFFVKCTNVSGVTQSNTVLLTVDPDIVTEPTNATVTAPAAHTFTVVGRLAQAPLYQWQLSTNSGVSWSNLTDTGVYTGSATASLIISNSTGLNANQYRVLLSNANGASISTAVILTVL